ESSDETGEDDDTGERGDDAFGDVRLRDELEEGAAISRSAALDEPAGIAFERRPSQPRFVPDLAHFRRQTAHESLIFEHRQVILFAFVPRAVTVRACARRGGGCRTAV